jgi:hypothetical protein
MSGQALERSAGGSPAHGSELVCGAANEPASGLAACSTSSTGGGGDLAGLAVGRAADGRPARGWRVGDAVGGDAAGAAVIAYRITRHVAGAGHRVQVDGDDFVARCGVRWSRRSDGGVRSAAERGELCRACEEVPC